MQINGRYLNVWVSGKSSSGTLGQDLILDNKTLTIAFVHGLGSTQNYYYALLPELVKRSNCILIDSEGSGLSDLNPTRPPTIDTLATDVKTILDQYHVNSNSVIIVGHSMGGIVASRYAELHPDSTVGIVLISPVHPQEAFRKPMEGRVATVETSNSVIPIADTVAQNAVGTSALPIHKAFIRDLISQQTPAGYISMCNAIVNAPVPKYSQINKPALIIVGDDDKTAPYETCTKIIEGGLIGTKTLHRLPGVGHWPCIEVSDVITELISKWIDEKF